MSKYLHKSPLSHIYAPITASVTFTPYKSFRACCFNARLSWAHVLGQAGMHTVVFIFMICMLIDTFLVSVIAPDTNIHVYGILFVGMQPCSIYIHDVYVY